MKMDVSHSLRRLFRTVYDMIRYVEGHTRESFRTDRYASYVMTSGLVIISQEARRMLRFAPDVAATVDLPWKKLVNLREIRNIDRQYEAVIKILLPSCAALTPDVFKIMQTRFERKNNVSEKTPA